MTIHMSARVTRLIATIAFVVLAFSGVTGRVHAQVQESTSVGGGTLYWTATYYSSVCGQYQTPFSYYSFSSFTFVQGGELSVEWLGCLLQLSWAKPKLSPQRSGTDGASNDPPV